MGASRLIGPPRHARPLALASAVATLVGALFLCLGARDTVGGGSFAEHERTTRHHASVVEQFVCPYDPAGCSLFPSLSPAVLSAPPPAAPLHPEGRPPRPGAPHHSGPAPGPAARARAPDLHVLQVLRT
ncbi:hypothetical protein [Streptomyces sp. NPDC048659]|uniref:hypothetical protein n=1 Tax=Streptomyces sp. NPDC048659 TaxID=3155489 RepID=UPI003415A72F